MGASPGWKVYAAGGEYRAACKFPEDAAALIAFLGDGSTIRHQHGPAVWTEGSETQPAAESFDHVAAVVVERINARIRERRGRAGLDVEVRS